MARILLLQPGMRVERGRPRPNEIQTRSPEVRARPRRPSARPAPALLGGSQRDLPSARGGPGKGWLHVRIAGEPEAAFRPGYRETVGWSRRPDAPREAQPHLQVIAKGAALMASFAPGLRRALVGALTVDPAFEAAIAVLDERVAGELARVTPSRREAEAKNVRLLELVADRHELWLQADEAAHRNRRAARPMMAELQAKLLRRHPPAARRRADQIRVHPDLQAKVPDARLRTWTRAFFALTGPNAPVPERLRFVPGAARAVFDATTGQIHIGADVDAATVFHELGHALEVDVLDVMLAAESWRAARAANAHRDPRPRPLRTLCPGSSYAEDEVALPDHFVSPYVGKVYEVFGSEVVSMGLEHLASAEGMVALFERDPEHFFFTLGLLEEVQP